jgi:hypothetical protein
MIRHGGNVRDPQPGTQGSPQGRHELAASVHGYPAGHTLVSIIFNGMASNHCIVQSIMVNKYMLPPLPQGGGPLDPRGHGENTAAGLLLARPLPSIA